MPSGDDASADALAVFADAADRNEPRTAAEVADELGCATDDAREALDALVDRGELQSRAVAGTRVWWRSGTAVTDDRDHVLNAVPAGVAMLDGDGRITWANDRASDLLAPSEAAGADGEDALSWEVRRPDGDPVSDGDHPIARALLHDETPPEFEHRVASSDGDERRLACRVAPTSTGAVLAVRDVTEREDRERALETELDDVLGRITDGVVGLDDDWRFTYVNDHAEELIGRDEAELLGESVREAFPKAVGTAFQTECERAMEGQEVVVFEEYCQPLESWFEVRAYPSETGLSVYVRDVTERRRLEHALTALHASNRELAHAESRDGVFETLIETAQEVLDLSDVVVYRYDSERDLLRPEAVTSDATDIYGRLPSVPPDESTITGRAFIGDGATAYDDVHDSELLRQGDVPMRSGLFAPIDGHGVFIAGASEPGAFDDDDRRLAELLAASAASALDRVDRELRYRERNEQLASLATASSELLDAASPEEVCTIATETVQSELPYDVAQIALYDEDRGGLRPVTQSVDDEFEARLYDSDAEPAWRAYADREPVAVTGLESADDRNAVVVPLGRHGVLVVGSSDGELVDAEGGTDSTGSEPSLARILASTVEAALDAVDRERDLLERDELLRSQNERLERLTRVNDVIRSIDQALVSATTREEIERAVCSQLTNAGPYAFAWIGAYDPVDAAVRPSEHAGVEESHLDAVTDGEGSIQEGPAADAVETGEPSATSDLLGDPPFERWRREALKRGYRSGVAIPLEYRDVLYGVLTVYADEPAALDDLERSVLVETSETIAYAINAVENRRALVSDATVEVECSVRDDDVTFVALADATDARVELESVGSNGDGGARAFFTVETETPESVVEHAARTPGLEDTRLVSVNDGVGVFECDLDPRGLVGTLLDQGAVPRSFTTAGTEGRLVVDLPREADLRSFVGTLQSKYEGVELVARRERDRSVGTRQEFRTEVDARLTDRQREVLRAAFLGGYFDTPRRSTGSELADGLDVSQPTFTKHLRSAERKLLEYLFEEGEPDGD